MAKPLRWYLRLLAGLTLVSCLGQLALPAELGAASAWGVAPGWQREIAFWDLAMYIVIARALRANDAAGGRTVAIALVVLQLLVATNHAAAAIQGRPMLNAIMGAVNYACAVFGAVALRVRAVGRVRPEPPMGDPARAPPAGCNPRRNSRKRLGQPANHRRST